MQQIITVIGVLGLLLATLGWLRRRGWVQAGRPRRVTQAPARSAWAWPFARPHGAPAEPVLQILERLPLTPTHTLHLVRVRNHTVLIATHTAGCHVVESAPGEPAGERLEVAG